MTTHYEVLGVSPRADLDTIKRAFRQAAKAHHPDLRGGADPASEHQLKLIIVAYNVLRDPDLRAEYDADLASERDRVRRERWDAILQFTAATAVLSAILIGLEILLLPSAGDWMSSPATRSIVTPSPQARSGPQRKVAGETVPAPAVQDATGAVLPVPPPEAEAPALSPPAEPRAAEQVVPAAPTTAASFLKRGMDRSRQGDLERAVADFDEAIRLAPRNADLYRYRARDLVRMGRIDRALGDFERAIRLDPNDPVLFHDRGLAHQRKGDLDEALVDLDHAVRMGFSDAGMYSDRGAVWLAKGRYDRALADFNQALKLDPELAIAAARRDEALARRRDRQLAGDDGAPPAAAETTGTVPADAKPRRSGR
ncbi:MULTISPECIES: J domain-containing protein [unclassified Bradyrhizobium]|uniref:J domain-containing protein n=1 Tax=unclassified Bradyrhizobium TaxID=2631580 RepID=UPI00291685E3|nr:MULTISPECIES: tetratricopeptide repeat protein [unclassified Bradyrhizobium]